jgi:hypothetical protein
MNIKNLTEKLGLLLRKPSVASFKYSTNIEFAHDCFSCEEQCNLHEQLPPTMQKRIDQSPLYKSFKPYKQHIIIPIGKGDQWEEHVEDGVNIIKQLNEKTSNSKDGRVMITAYEETTGDSLPVLFFPQGIQVSLEIIQNNIDVVAEWASCSNNTDFPLESTPIAESATIFVCNHKKRDKRCGVAGPILIEEFKKQFTNQNMNVPVHGISHIGGHKFAGNIIIYRKDCRGILVGDWYGRVRTCHVQGFIKNVIEDGKVIQELWRGQMNADPNDPSLNW